MKKILAILLAALLLMSFVACNKDKEGNDNSQTNSGLEVSADLIYGDFKYDTNEYGDYEITDFIYVGITAKEIEIPAEISGRAVTGIAPGAFKSSKTISKVTLPSSIEYIGDYAFYDCDLITSITLPESVTTIGNCAFENCSALESLTLPKSLLKIGDGAFKNCTALKNFTINDGLLSLGAAAFWGCSSITSVTIPATVVEIGDAAFYKCSSLAQATYLGISTDADKQITDKMTAALAAYAQKNGKPENFYEVEDILVAAGYYLGNTADNGIGYVWDADSNQMIGAVTAEDAEMLTKMNNALAAAAQANKFPTSLNSALIIISDAEPELETVKLNVSVLSGSKYVWDAETNTMTSINLGDIIFHDCAENFKLTVTAGSEMANYAVENEYTLA